MASPEFSLFWAVIAEPFCGQAIAGGSVRLTSAPESLEVYSLDKLLWGIMAFKHANRNQFNLPFSEFMRKVAKVDPIEAAPRLRNRRQEPKK